MHTRICSSWLSVVVVWGLVSCGGDELSGGTVGTLAAGDGVNAALSGAALRSSYSLEGGYYESPRTVMDQPVTRVGFHLELDVPRGLSPVVQVRGDDGLWRLAQITWQETGSAVGRVDLAEPTSTVQLRLPVAIGDHVSELRWVALDITPTPASQPPQLGLGLSADSHPYAGVTPRSIWGARPSRCTGGDQQKERITLHHTATPPRSGGSIEKRARAIQAFHMDVKDWCDIGYHYLVGIDGTVLEGRASDLVGAHVVGSNQGNMGVALIGCFQEADCNGWGPAHPPEEALAATVHLIREVTAAHDLPQDASALTSHRDIPGASTVCPGHNLAAQIQAIRNEVGAGFTLQPNDHPAGDSCGELTGLGECVGELLRWCDGTQVRTIDCATRELSCGWRDSSIGYDCLTTTTGCGDLDFFGECQGTTLHWCDGGVPRTIECGSFGATCGWQSTTIGYNCL